jgi:hypothetical protein
MLSSILSECRENRKLCCEGCALRQCCARVQCINVLSVVTCHHVSPVLWSRLVSKTVLLYLDVAVYVVAEKAQERLAASPVGEPLHWDFHQAPPYHYAFGSPQSLGRWSKRARYVVVIVKTIELQFIGLRRRAGESGPSRRERLHRATPTSRLHHLHQPTR